MARIALVSSRIAKALLLELSTGSWAFTARSPTGSSVRVSSSISWFSGSAAMAWIRSTIDESWVWLQTNGISVRSKSGIARTSTSKRPVSGIRLATPSSGSRVASGSTSITISSPGRMTSAGISALADVDRVLSLTSVGIVADLPGMFSTCVSRPST